MPRFIYKYVEKDFEFKLKEKEWEKESVLREKDWKWEKKIENGINNLKWKFSYVTQRHVYETFLMAFWCEICGNMPKAAWTKMATEVSGFPTESSHKVSVVVQSLLMIRSISFLIVHCYFQHVFICVIADFHLFFVETTTEDHIGSGMSPYRGETISTKRLW